MTNLDGRIKAFHIGGDTTRLYMGGRLDCTKRESGGESRYSNGFRFGSDFEIKCSNIGIDLESYTVVNPYAAFFAFLNTPEAHDYYSLGFIDLGLSPQFVEDYGIVSNSFVYRQAIRKKGVLCPVIGINKGGSNTENELRFLDSENRSSQDYFDGMLDFPFSQEDFTEVVEKVLNLRKL
ncbi:MAG: hypothetical protein ACOCXG_02855 [Nanoarchaeota archaeon]